jgi:hypothetical protein
MKFKEWLALDEANSNKNWTRYGPYAHDYRFELGPKKGDTDNLIRQGLDAMVGAHSAVLHKAMYSSGDRPVVYPTKFANDLFQPYVEIPVHLESRMLKRVGPKNNRQMLALAVQVLQKQLAEKGEEGTRLYQQLLWDKAEIINGRQNSRKEGGDGSADIILKIPKNMDVYREPQQPDNLNFNYRDYRRRKKPQLRTAGGSRVPADSIKNKKKRKI